MKCFYHSADLDGRCSGAIVKMTFPECQMIGINYGEAFPWESIDPGETVVMVDFSLQPFADMERLNGLADLIWIDHHKTAIEEAHERCFLASGAQVLVNGRAGCELAWEHFVSGLEMPRAVFLLGRYDVWDHENHPGALAFQYGMRRYDASVENLDFWTDLFYGDLQREIESQGQQLLDYQTEENRKYAATCAFDVELDGLRCVAMNKGLTNSLLFSSVWDRDKYDAMLSFYFKKGQWKVSLYSDKPGIDCSAICKARGGGGHKGAAGFQCDVLPFSL